MTTVSDSSRASLFSSMSSLIGTEDAETLMTMIPPIPWRDFATKQDIENLKVTFDARFEQVDARFDHMEARFEMVDARFNRVDARFNRVDARLNRSDERFEQILSEITHVTGKLHWSVTMTLLAFMVTLVMAIVALRVF